MTPEEHYKAGHLHLRGGTYGEDLIQAFEHYMAAAKEGHGLAQNNVATMYADGKGVDRDFVRAKHWYGVAIAQGEACAMDNMYMMTIMGYGCTASREDAMEWYKMGREQRMRVAPVWDHNIMHLLPPIVEISVIREGDDTVYPSCVIL